jgi:hypothetical protein
MIKKIHYCWFGSPKPPNVVANVEEWKRLNPDFTFHEWNEQNIDVSKYEFGRRALKDKRWGFLVDIIRPQKLYEEGGFYIDADVELIRPLNIFEFEREYLVMGYMFDCALGTAVLYSPPGHPILKSILNEYHHIMPNSWPVSNSVFTDYFLNHLPGFLLNGRRWKGEAYKISLYPKEFFEQPAFMRNRGVSIHHYSGSWIPSRSSLSFSTGASIYSHEMKWLNRKQKTFLSLMNSEYRRAYFRALFGLSSHMDSVWRSESPV